MIVIPIAMVEGSLLALTPIDSLFGSEIEDKQRRDKAASDAALTLACTAEPLLAHTASRGESCHYVFAVPPREPPRASDLTFSDAAWGRPSLLQGADTIRYLYVSLALQRMRHLFFPSVRGAEVIGTLGEAQPLVASTTSSAWLRKVPDPAA